MSEEPTEGSSNLPEDFRMIFLHTSQQIHRFGDAIFSADFAFLVTEMVFRVDFQDESRNSQAASFRSFVYEGFGGNREFVDKTIERLVNNRQEYLQSLYAQGLIYLWTSLESLVKQLVAKLIDLDSKVLAAESFKKVKIPMAEFFRLDDDEKASYLTDLVISDLNCGRERGVGRFDCILNAFGLGGDFSAVHKARILALHNLRNCIVHNDSIADARLCEQSGSLAHKIGDKIVISQEDFRAYEQAVLAYTGEIYYRLNKAFREPERFLLALRDRLDGMLLKGSEVP